MNSNSKDPVMGSPMTDDAAAAELVIDDLSVYECDINTAFTMPGNSNYSLEKYVNDLSSYYIESGEKKQMREESVVPRHRTAMEEDAEKEENNIDIEETIVNFNNNNNIKFQFLVVESEREKNKPYEVEQNFITAKLDSAIKIRAVGAHSGHHVKMSLRYKAESHYEQPVEVCRLHNSDAKPNQEATFYVARREVDEFAVVYQREEGHHTALVTVPAVMEGDAFVFFPIFRCRNSCIKVFGRHQEIILKLCDSTTGKVLHRSSFNIRVCENVGRDAAHIKQEKKGVKRLRKNSNTAQPCSPVGLRTPKLPLQQDQGAAVASLEPMDEMKYQVPAPYSAPDVSPSGGGTGTYMVVLDDDLYPVLFALAKLKERGKVVRLDPALVQRLTHY